ncbi:MAG TPA: hypothetical protein ENN79_12645 [Desulfobacteraceae bacterium]|nr:hypothetical protein [Desulfobacteraceae bacterium]
MWTRNFWLVLCLCTVISAPTANAKVSQEPQLRRIIPADVLAYIRIPNLWGFLSDPKGSVLDDALINEAHRRIIEAVKESMGERFLKLADPKWSTLIQTVFSQLASPLELALEMNEGQPLQTATFLISATFSCHSLEEFKSFLTGFTGNSPDLNLLSDVSPDGHAILTARDMPIFVHYDAEKRLFRAMIGMSVNESMFKEKLANLTPVETHPMYPFENETDESRQGFFAWFNAAKIMPAIKDSMPPRDLEAMEKWGLTDVRGVALGWGVSKGKGCLKLSIDAPKTGYRKLFPDIQNNFSLSASGMPETVVTLSLRLKEITRAVKTLAEEENIQALRTLREADNMCQEYLKMPLDDVLEAFGPEMIVFRDKIDTFLALEIGNSEEMNRLLTNISNHPDTSLETHEKDGKQYWHLKLPSIFSQAAKEETTRPSERLASGILNAIKTHLFWTQDGDYLVFSSVPQALFDRADFLERVPIKSWIDKTHDAQHAVLNLSTCLPGVPSKLYYAYLQFLCLLGDISGHPVDLFDLPSARQADLPLMGAYGFKIDWADPVVSLSFTFENNPLEFLLAQNTSATIAAAGFMAAVAIPNFLAYRTRAYDAEANADIKNAYLAVQAYFTDHPGGTVTLEDLMRIGYRRSEGVALTIENGAEDTLKMSSHHEKGKTVYFIDSMGNIEEISR